LSAGLSRTTEVPELNLIPHHDAQLRFSYSEFPPHLVSLEHGAAVHDFLGRLEVALLYERQGHGQNVPESIPDLLVMGLQIN